MNLSIIAVVIVLLVVILMWRHAMKAREAAIYMALQMCRKWDVQLLDDTVCLTKMKLSRSGEVGGLCFFREYAFEYTIDGVERLRALLQFNGAHFIQVISNNQRVVPKEIAQESAPSYQQKQASGNNIIDFAAYKKKHDKNKSHHPDNDQKND